MGNKADVSKNERKVSEEEVQRLAAEDGTTYLEFSAKESRRDAELREAILRNFHRMRYPPTKMRARSSMARRCNLM